MTIIEKEVELVGSKGRKKEVGLFDSGATYSCIEKELAGRLGIVDKIPVPFACCLCDMEKMEGECFACIHACPVDALEIDKEVSCVRLEGSTPLRVDDEKCDQCNQCNEVCPMGNITLSASGCSFCIICKGRPSCISSSNDRAFFLNFILSIAYFIIACRKIIKKKKE